METTVISYLSYLGIPISKGYVSRLIQSHPDYPSLMSVSDVLQRLGVPHQAVRMRGSKVKDLAPPFLLKSESDATEFQFIKTQKDLPGLNKLSEEILAIVLQVEPIKELTDTYNNNARRKDYIWQWSAGILGITTICILGLLSAPLWSDWLYAGITVTALVGLMLGYVLFIYDLGIKNESIKAFCDAGKRTSCDLVLHSDKARLFGGVKLSDAVFAYFIFQTLSIFFLLTVPGYGPTVLPILATLSLLVLPMGGYLIYVQFAEVKSWCKLCLLVDGLLVVQAGLFFVVLYREPPIVDSDLQVIPALLLLFIMTGVGSVVMLLKTELEKYDKIKTQATLSGRIKNNPEVFTHLLGREKKVNTTFFDHEMLIGEAEAPLNIVMASNLNCGPCKEGFEKAMKIINTYPGDINLCIRFFHTDKEEDGETPATSTYLLAYWLENICGNDEESRRTAEMLQDWFSIKNMDTFTQKYSMKRNGQVGAAKSLGNQHQAWMEQAKVSRTPSFFINGYSLPDLYTIDDLIVIIPGLIEELPENLQSEQKPVSVNT